MVVDGVNRSNSRAVKRAPPSPRPNPLLVSEEIAPRKTPKAYSVRKRSVPSPTIKSKETHHTKVAMRLRRNNLKQLVDDESCVPILSSTTAKDRHPKKQLARALQALKCSTRAVEDEYSSNPNHHHGNHVPLSDDVSPTWNTDTTDARPCETRDSMLGSNTDTTKTNSQQSISINEEFWMARNFSGVDQAPGMGTNEQPFEVVCDVAEQTPEKLPTEDAFEPYPHQQLRNPQQQPQPEKEPTSSTIATKMAMSTIQTESSSSILPAAHQEQDGGTIRAAVSRYSCFSFSEKKLDGVPEESAFMDEGNNSVTEDVYNGPLHKIPTNSGNDNTVVMSNRGVLCSSPSATLTIQKSGTPPRQNNTITSCRVPVRASSPAPTEPVGPSLADSITTHEDTSVGTDTAAHDEVLRFIHENTVTMTFGTKPPEIGSDQMSPEQESDEGRHTRDLAHTLLAPLTQRKSSKMSDHTPFEPRTMSIYSPPPPPPPPPPPRGIPFVSPPPPPPPPSRSLRFVSPPPPPPPLRQYTQEKKIAEQDDTLSGEKISLEDLSHNALQLVPSNAGLTFGLRRLAGVHKSAAKTTIVTQLSPPIFRRRSQEEETNTGTESSFSSVSSFADLAGKRQSKRFISRFSSIAKKQSPNKPHPFFWRSHPKVTVRSYDPQAPRKSPIREVVVPHLRQVTIGDSASFDVLYFGEHESHRDSQDGTDRTKGGRDGGAYEPHLLPTIVQKMWIDSNPPRLEVKTDREIASKKCREANSHLRSPPRNRLAPETEMPTSTDKQRIIDGDSSYSKQNNWPSFSSFVSVLPRVFERSKTR